MEGLREYIFSDFNLMITLKDPRFSEKDLMIGFRNLIDVLNEP